MSMNYTPLKNLTLFELKDRVKTLKHFCLSLDPYSPLNKEEKQRLSNLGLKNNELNDPFALTNTLILSIEDAIDEIHRRERTPPPMQ